MGVGPGDPKKNLRVPGGGSTTGGVRKRGSGQKGQVSASSPTPVSVDKLTWALSVGWAPHAHLVRRAGRVSICQAACRGAAGLGGGLGQWGVIPWGSVREERKREA